MRVLLSLYCRRGRVSVQVGRATLTAGKQRRSIMTSAKPWKTLTSTEELNQRLSSTPDKHLLVLDAAFKGEKTEDVYHTVYMKGHIRGARFFDLHACVNSTPLVPRNLPETYCFTKRIRGLGIDRDTEIVVYDHSKTPEAAARAWWLFRLFGHTTISILDGGYQKWVADGYDVTTEEPPPATPTDYEVKMNLALIRDMDDMKAIIAGNKEQILDARTHGHFTGKDDHSKSLTGGHIPNARNLPNVSLFKGDGTYKSKEELQKLFDGTGADLQQPMITMCRTGMMACSLAAAAHQIGITTVPVYYGSWMEWAQINTSDSNIVKESSP